MGRLNDDNWFGNGHGISKRGGYLLFFVLVVDLFSCCPPLQIIVAVDSSLVPPLDSASGSDSG